MDLKGELPDTERHIIIASELCLHGHEAKV